MSEEPGGEHEEYSFMYIVGVVGRVSLFSSVILPILCSSYQKQKEFLTFFLWIGKKGFRHLGSGHIASSMATRKSSSEKGFFTNPLDPVFFARFRMLSSVWAVR